MGLCGARMTKLETKRLKFHAWVTCPHVGDFEYLPLTKIKHLTHFEYTLGVLVEREKVSWALGKPVKF
jgi:hypothetical protein